MKANQEHFLWTERFRPQTLDECILSKSTTEELKGFLKQGQIPHFLFTSTPGTGKTTVAKALARELGADLLFINASNENGIDTVRMKITQFASTASFDSNLKIILLDEADRLSKAAQESLRSTFETFAESTRFILTGNNRSGIIDAVQSRCTTIEFKIPDNEKEAVSIKIFKRLIGILDEQGVEYDKKAIAALVQKDFPDMRKMLNKAQRYAAKGRIDSGVLVALETNTDDLLEAMKAKKFVEVRKWVAKNTDVDAQDIFRLFYDISVDMFKADTVPAAIICTAQYQDMSRNVQDQEINTMAYLIEMMGTIEWK